MSDVNITINGGNNQILPNATEAVQNFYGDGFSEKVFAGKQPGETLPAEAQRLLIYIGEEQLPRYLALIGECRSAAELGKVVVDMCAQEPRLTKEEIVKERFIRLLLPLASNFTVGKTVSNIRARINDALANQPRQRPWRDGASM